MSLTDKYWIALVKSTWLEKRVRSLNTMKEKSDRSCEVNVARGGRAIAIGQYLIFS
ncbi:hypothetical protein A0J48_000725 [Sphaerospermopsis aphanizomenoides BCCUSP55]|uniref:hypothetical protein n=1 Tax=Sphaerospermopsis aphanizomenoides TaxID=459663 RepID=UPI001902FEDE|nr:hypothetical protein [Sphaerospermopsis aphanizomenoides]MBK1986089.1 hypothetical protein [Sphaerospermopsis aphanizomenoides BCCUSP55]